MTHRGTRGRPAPPARDEKAIPRARAEVWPAATERLRARKWRAERRAWAEHGGGHFLPAPARMPDAATSGPRKLHPQNRADRDTRARSWRYGAAALPIPISRRRIPGLATV